MKEIELCAILELINVYSRLYKCGLTKEVVTKAKSLYNELTPGHTLLSNIVNSAVGNLFSVAYYNVDPDRKIPCREDIKVILRSLKMRKQELEK